MSIEEFDAGLRRSLGVSAAPVHKPSEPDGAPLEPLDKKVLSDPLVGVSFSERGTMAEWNFGFSCAKQRLRENPEDTYLRAILVWSTLLKGDPNQIIEVVQDAATWLQSDKSLDFDHTVEQNSKLWPRRRELWLKKIAGIRDATIEDPGFVRRVLEDTLVREALLRWLKSTGKSSPLGVRIRSIKTQGIPYAAMAIFKLPQRQHKEDWVPNAIKRVNNWISAEHSRGLAKLYLLWLTGRDPGRNEIQSVIEKTFDWLDHHPSINDTLVRWGTIWLAGMLESEQFTTPIFERTSKWLKSPASEGDRLVRTALLWFLGEQGNARHVKSAIAETTEWLSDPRNQNDTCIRIALLFCIRRAVERGAGTSEQFRAVIDELPARIRKDQLIELAVDLAKCPLPIPH